MIEIGGNIPISSGAPEFQPKPPVGGAAPSHPMTTSQKLVEGTVVPFTEVKGNASVIATLRKDHETSEGALTSLSVNVTAPPGVPSEVTGAVGTVLKNHPPLFNS